MRRLTEEQREWIGTPRCRQIARVVAATWARRYPWLADDLDQAAALGLVRAARRFNPSLGVRFDTYADRCVRSEVANYVRGFSRPRGYRHRKSASIPVTASLGSDDGDWLADGADDRPGWCVDEQDAVEWLTRDLPHRIREAIRLHYLHAGATKRIIGAHLGVSESRACQMVTEGLKMLREQARATA